MQGQRNRIEKKNYDTYIERKMRKIIVILLMTSLQFFPCLIFAQGNGLYEFIGQNGKYGFMDKTGKVVIPARYVYVEYPGFSEGLAFVSEKRTTDGDHIWICIDTLGNTVFRVGRKKEPETSFSEGYAVIYNWFVDKYWFVNKKGKRVFNKNFKDACEFTNGYARVESRKFGDNSYFIDKKGKYAKHLPLNGSIFNNGISYCGWKLIDTLGNVLIDDIHEWTGASNEFLKVRRNDKWGFVDRKGNIIIDFQY